MSGMVLADLERAMAAADLGACSDGDLARLLRRALQGRQVVEGFVNRLAGEARRREAAGSSSPAQEVIRSGGVVSNREAKALDRRAGVGDVLPMVGERVDQGVTRGENADILARQLQHLTDDQRRALAVHDDEIARQAVCAPPEVFAKWLGRRIRAITEADPGEGESREERQRAASEFEMKRRGDGMWQLWGQLDQARGAELNDVITRAARRLNDGEVTANARADALHRLTTRRPSTEPMGTDHDPAAVEDDVPVGFDPGARMGIGYIVDAATLSNGTHNNSVAQTWGGHDIDPADIGRLVCDTDLYAILYDELGQPTRIGRTQHAATREQRLQLRGLYD
ncbi:MAG: hypothetical protein ACR2QO_10860, partial [Acidimicrobiales bacterium]